MSRLLLFSGKGGVGKTTIAASAAVTAAQEGIRTLVVSLDRAHNLNAVLGMTSSSAPRPVDGAPRLSSMEIDPQVELRSQWRVVQETMGRMLAFLGANEADADAISVLPGIEELLVLSRLTSLAESRDWDLVVVDLAPTASSLRYLSFPDLMSGLLGRLAHLERGMAKLMRPFFRAEGRVPIPEDRFYAALDEVAESLERLRRHLLDPERTVARLVSLPERIVVDETAAALSALSLYGIAVDAVVMNRVLPEAMSQGPWTKWREVQERELERGRELFEGLAWKVAPFQAAEPLGVKALASLGQELWGKGDPGRALAKPRPLRILLKRGGAELQLPVVGVAQSALDVLKTDRGVVVTVGAWRRTVPLPPRLADAHPVSAVVRDGVLSIQLSLERRPKS